jgi:hypothetical protein
MDNFEKAARMNVEKGDRQYARRLRCAGQIVRALVAEALKRGFTVSVYRLGRVDVEPLDRQSGDHGRPVHDRHGHHQAPPRQRRRVSR